MEKENKEKTPEQKYVAFHRERERPVDCFSRHEVDKKLKAQRESFNKKLQEQKDEIEEYHKEEIENLKAQFGKILKKIGDEFKEYYTQDKVDQFFNVLKASDNNIQWGFESLEKHVMKIEGLVFEYLNVTDIGKMVGNRFVLNEKKKKRLWKK